MVSEPSIALTGAHAGKIAEKLRDLLDNDLDTIAGNKGYLSRLRHQGRRNVSEMSDAEISAYVAGLHSMAIGFADWLEHSGAFDYSSGDPEGSRWSDMYSIRKHKVNCEMIGEDIVGAEGENFYRRHPQKHAFAGRLRKFNDRIAQLRNFRAALADTYDADLGKREPGSLLTSSDLAYQWLRGEREEIRKWLSKLDRSTAGLTDEEREAWQRINAEFHALERYCARVREAYSDQLRHQSTALALGRRVA